MDLREYQEKLAAQLKDLTAKMEEFKAQAAKGSAEVKAAMNKQVEAMKPRLEAAQQKLQALQAASGPAWQKLKEGAEKAVAEVKQTWESIKSKFG